MAALTVKRILVKADRIIVTVVMDARAPQMTTPVLAARFCRVVPSLRNHACVNGVGPTFGDIICNTSIPHVMEHLIIDAQVRADRGAQASTFVGTTEWTNRHAGIAKIEISYADDITALAAIKQAAAIINEIVKE